MLEDIIGERKRIRKLLQDQGQNPYPASVRRTIEIGDLLKSFPSLKKSEKRIFAVGRITALRDQGNIIFLDIADASGTIQVLVRKNETKQFDTIKESLHGGDFVEVGGSALLTKRKEKSIAAVHVRIIAKGIRSVPTQWYGLKDTEERFRKRYLDLLLNTEVKEKMERRSEIIQKLREVLWKEGFLEMETPVLQTLAGGALARPFITHHNALDTDFYLRIAPELYLKRLLVGGFEKIFEIGRVFRNEGIDREHNPEFTMLELYWAYQDYKGLMQFTRKILKPYIPGTWPTITFAEACKKYGKKDFTSVPADTLDEFFKKEVRPKLIKPIFVIDYPENVMPLAKYKEEDQKLTESFQLIMNGAEIVKGFSEMNDPIVQREQMKEQERQFRAGNKEVTRLDEDYLEAMEYGMPPAAGLGIGIDRLVALATKTRSIKEIIMFPTLRPKKLVVSTTELKD